MIRVDVSDFKDVIRDLTSDMGGLQQYLRSTGFETELRELVGQNFEVVWSSKGAVIGENWDGNTLVDTGNLRDSLTTPGRLNVTQVGDRLVFSSDASYAPYVNARFSFYGLSPQTESAIVELINRWLKTYGQLRWS